MSYWCPCIVFGKTQQRLVDPRLEHYETMNNNVRIHSPVPMFLPCFFRVSREIGSESSSTSRSAKLTKHDSMQCLIWFGLSCAGLHWIIQMLKRNEMRERFNLQGSQGMDCLASCCCSCCEMMQSEKEAVYRLQANDAAAATSQGYQKSEPMTTGTLPA